MALDRDGELVVIELKRTEDGGHMELQAVRYAAMVSKMTTEQAFDAFREYRKRRGLDGDGEELINEFVTSPGGDDLQLNADSPRIVLASGDFSKELTTSVLWLNELGLDIRCVRLKLYRSAEGIYLDAQQVLPLPEAEEYMVRVRAREAERRATRDRREPTAVILVREGLIAPGTEIVFRTEGMPGVPDVPPETWRARFSDDPAGRRNVVWEADNNPYSVSGLAGVLRDRFTLPLPENFNGYLYWSLASDPEQTLFEAAHGTKR